MPRFRHFHVELGHATAARHAIQKFDSNGKFVRGFGANMFNQPHGLYVDNESNVWAADNGARNGKGAIVVKFSPTGQVLMTLGKAGMARQRRGLLQRRKQRRGCTQW